MTKYPETHTRLNGVLEKIRGNAELVKKLLLSDKGHKVVSDTLLDFTKQIFADGEVKTILADQIRYQDVLIFLYHNADWMVGMQNHFIDQAKILYSSTKEGRKNSGFGDVEDLFNTLVKEAAAISLHDVNVDASTSGNADSAGTR